MPFPTYRYKPSLCGALVPQICDRHIAVRLAFLQCRKAIDEARKPMIESGDEQGGSCVLGKLSLGS